jgi:hypothetical protein
MAQANRPRRIARRFHEAINPGGRMRATLVGCVVMASFIVTFGSCAAASPYDSGIVRGVALAASCFEDRRPIDAARCIDSSESKLAQKSESLGFNYLAWADYSYEGLRTQGDCDKKVAGACGYRDIFIEFASKRYHTMLRLAKELNFNTSDLCVVAKHDCTKTQFLFDTWRQK